MEQGSIRYNKRQLITAYYGAGSACPIVLRRIIMKLEKIDSVMSKIEHFVIVFTFSLMCVLLFAQVFSRKIFNLPIPWTEELSRYLFVWFVYIGVSYAIKEKSHVSVSFIMDKLSSRTHAAFSIFIYLIMIAILIIILPCSVRFVKSQFVIAATATEIPMGYVYLALPIGFVMSIARSIIEILKLSIDIKKQKEG